MRVQIVLGVWDRGVPLRLRGPGLPLSCVQMALHQPEGSISERRSHADLFVAL